MLYLLKNCKVNYKNNNLLVHTSVLSPDAATYPLSQTQVYCRLPDGVLTQVDPLRHVIPSQGSIDWNKTNNMISKYTNVYNSLFNPNGLFKKKKTTKKYCTPMLRVTNIRRVDYFTTMASASPKGDCRV